MAAPPKVEDVKVVGKAVEGNVIKGVGRYVGGNQGPCIYHWFRLDTNTKERVLLSTTSNEYTLTKEDVGRCLVFQYTPVNTVGKCYSYLFFVGCSSTL